MSGTLWGAGAPLAGPVDTFTASADRQWDRRLLPWDVLGTLGHLEGLVEAGIVTSAERLALRGALRDALDAVSSGALTVTESDEDCHTVIERFLVERCGETGEKVHTGRSRNDQVQAAMRLMMKDSLLAVAEDTIALAEVLATFAGAHERVVWPGYTHLRRAMPSSIALWASSFAESLLDDVGPIEAVMALVDRSPLGSAAGYGVPLPLDRERVAQALGFAGVQRNVIAVQSARGKSEALAASALWAVGYDLGKLAWDVILFASPEYGFLELPGGIATGSSIMPQKANPDIFELTRARAGALGGLVTQIMAVCGPLPSGYQRDLQEVKAPMIQAFDIVTGMLRAMAWAVPGIGVNEPACRAAVSGDLLATDEVYRRVREGHPFRRAYREVAAELRRGIEPPPLGPEAILQSRRSTGAPGNLGLQTTQELIAAARESVAASRARFHAAMAGLVEEEAT